ncbi:acyltransferase [Curvivirga aplysinae]|uniref:acyltransferase n=1 Tax=Curvivirga aplysinae TaxID=2529852 RepID=UPI0012BBD245|nr:transferase hexapeptide repeat family protein [Curvivirga aplysinae]MTI09867.1 transferase hexapeptide repeat family protein [Curvivirga aplysinae]
MAKIYSYDDVIPVVDPKAYVHETAVVIGDVIIGPDVYVGPNCVLRGDFGRIILKQGSNFQDTCVAHSFPDMEMVVEEDGHIGHGAVLHGCQIGKNALVGMNSVIMDGAKIGENSIVAAMSFVKANFDGPANSLIVGSPAKVLRELSEKEIAWKSEGTSVYQQLARDSFTKMKAVDPLPEIEEGRRTVRAPKATPFHMTKDQLED